MATEKQFLNYAGLSTLLNKLKEKLATKAAVNEVTTNTDTYILNIDYEKDLKFETDALYRPKDAYHSETINVQYGSFSYNGLTFHNLNYIVIDDWIPDALATECYVKIVNRTSVLEGGFPFWCSSLLFEGSTISDSSIALAIFYDETIYQTKVVLLSSDETLVGTFDVPITITPMETYYKDEEGT